MGLETCGPSLMLLTGGNMRSLLIGLCVGAGAGILDILPMLIQRLPARATASAFVQWLVLGLVIAHVRSPLPQWAAGLAVGLLCAIPIVLIVSEKEPGSIPIILGTSAVLGAFCGLAVGLLG
jgi:hypothetical protein